MKTWVATNGQLLEIDKICSVIRLEETDKGTKYNVTFKTGGGITVYGHGLMSVFTKTVKRRR